MVRVTCNYVLMKSTFDAHITVLVAYTSFRINPESLRVFLANEIQEEKSFQMKDIILLISKMFQANFTY